MSLDTKGLEAHGDFKNVQHLKDELDTLWIRYLDAVDIYQASITAISKHMAEGFFSLAQANRRNSSRRRYGQDFYDQRMKASRLCGVSLDDNDHSRIAIYNTAAVSDSVDAAATDKPKDEPTQQPSPPTTPEPEEPKVEQDAREERAPEDSSEDTSKQSSSAAKDPIRWYGVLIPQELRTTQSHFVASMSDDMSTLANSARDLRALEVDIRRLRKTIKKAAKTLI